MRASRVALCVTATLVMAKSSAASNHHTRIADALRVYETLSQLPAPQSYTGKIFLVAFLGTHIPLLTAVGYTALSSLTWAQATPILQVTLLATLVGTGCTLWVLHRLLAPIRCTAAAMQRYVDTHEPPDLPTHFTDRAGQLMQNTQRTLTKLSTLLAFKDRMLGVVSHDARGPASSVLMAVDAIAKQLDTDQPNMDQVRSLTEQVEHTVEYQLDVFQSMLDVARYGEGQITLREETDRAGAVMERVKQNLHMLAEERDHAFEVQVEQPDLKLHTDIGKLEQILNNLGNNALKYTPPGGTVELEMRTTEEHIVFFVSDTGPGISDSLRDELFEAYRAEADPDTDSVGLGLWICKTFTEALDGAIDVTETSNKGTTFEVRFPRDVLETSPTYQQT